VLIVIGIAQAALGRRADLIAAAQAVAAPTRSDAGCEAYGFYTNVLDDDAILSVEIWRDQAALDEHMTHEHTRVFIDAVGGLVAGEPVMTFYEVSAGTT